MAIAGLNLILATHATGYVLAGILTTAAAAVVIVVMMANTRSEDDPKP